ncbi:hypothetical protein KM043_013700 [Ampulex compressa]|nr:hypothetical protein KM043_013700 [Ampulex compressa]
MRRGVALYEVAHLVAEETDAYDQERGGGEEPSISHRGCQDVNHTLRPQRGVSRTTLVVDEDLGDYRGARADEDFATIASTPSSIGSVPSSTTDFYGFQVDTRALQDVQPPKVPLRESRIPTLLRTIQKMRSNEERFYDIQRRTILRRGEARLCNTFEGRHDFARVRDTILRHIRVQHGSTARWAETALQGVSTRRTLPRHGHAAEEFYNRAKSRSFITRPCNASTRSTTIPRHIHLGLQDAQAQFLDTSEHHVQFDLQRVHAEHSFTIHAPSNAIPRLVRVKHARSFDEDHDARVTEASGENRAAVRTATRGSHAGAARILPRATRLPDLQIVLTPAFLSIEQQPSSLQQRFSPMETDFQDHEGSSARCSKRVEIRVSLSCRSAIKARVPARREARPGSPPGDEPEAVEGSTPGRR